MYALSSAHDLDPWKAKKNPNLELTRGEIAGARVTLVLPDTYMNKSGGAVSSVVKSAAAAKRLVVLYDDIDLPLGSIKIAFSRGSGGHRGVESIAKALKTKDFVRIRMGVCPTTKTGKCKKPKGEEAVVSFLLKRFSKAEGECVERAMNRALGAVEMILGEGLEKAMQEYNRGA